MDKAAWFCPSSLHLSHTDRDADEPCSEKGSDFQRVKSGQKQCLKGLDQRNIPERPTVPHRGKTKWPGSFISLRSLRLKPSFCISGPVFIIFYRFKMPWVKNKTLMTCSTVEEFL